MNPWCAPTRPPRRSFVASDARCREQVCTVPTRPETTYRSGNAVQTTGTTSVYIEEELGNPNSHESMFVNLHYSFQTRMKVP